MSGRSDPNGSPACADPARELLDFHVNGSLEGPEAAMVAAHVATCRDCAREVSELSSLAGAIESFGVATTPGRRSGPWPWAWMGTVAAMVAAGLVALAVLRSFGTAPRPADPPTGAEVLLDLGVGEMRNAAAPPVVVLTPAATVLRVALLPPVLPGAHFRITVLGPGGTEIAAEAPLADPDAMGRATIPLPVPRLSSAGVYQVVLRTTAADGSRRTFFYPFEVRPTASR